MEYSTDPNQNPQKYHDHYQQQQSAYDPTQYDQSTAHYAYANQQQFANDQHQFYPPQGSYTQHQQPYPQFHQESGSIHPPGVPVRQSFYYQTQEPVEGQGVNPGSGSGSGGFNPAGATAVVAVPQVVNFSGNMDAVQRPKLPSQPAYKGRRGGRSFQGGGRGRGQLGHHGPRRGDGHGNGRRFHHGAAAAIQNSTSVPSEVASSSVLASAPSQAPAALIQPSQSKARCELCNVDCNTSEVLEQHINGKRHKKKLLMHEQSQKLNKVVSEEQNVQPKPSSGPEPVQLEKVDECKEKQLQQNGLPSDGTDGCIKEAEQQKDTEECSAAAIVSSTDAKRKSLDQFESGGRSSSSSKRKMRGGGRGSKYMKTNQGPRRTVEPPKPKEVIPFICEICNVKCETLVVFNSHLSGKKHFANLKKNGYRAGAGFQALNPPNYNGSSSSFSNPQVQQVLADPQAILAQLLAYVISQAQVQGQIAPQLPLPEALLASMQAPFASTEIPTQYASYLQTQGSLTMLQDGSKSSNVAPTESGNQLQSIMVNNETPQPAGTDVRAEKALCLPQGNSVMAPPENQAVQALEVLPSATSNNVTAPEETAMKEVTE